MWTTEGDISEALQIAFLIYSSPPCSPQRVGGIRPKTLCGRIPPRFVSDGGGCIPSEKVGGVCLIIPPPVYSPQADWPFGPNTGGGITPILTFPYKGGRD